MDLSNSSRMHPVSSQSGPENGKALVAPASSGHGWALLWRAHSGGNFNHDVKCC